MIKYFVNYTVKYSNGRSGEGSASINRTSPVTDIDDIRAMETSLMIENRGKYEWAHINNWRRFE